MVEPAEHFGMGAVPAVPAWLLGMLQAGDSFYPTGSYAHSFGLEAIVQEGVVTDRDTLRAFLISSALPALRGLELPLASHAWHAFGARDWDLIGHLCRLSAASRTAPEARQASESVGLQRAELIERLHRHPIATEYLKRHSDGNWPHSSAVSVALEGQVLGAPLPAVLAGAAYSAIAALISAAIKLLRLGQNATQSLLAEVLALMPEAVEAAQRVSLEDIGWFNPWLDIAAARHESADSRMFIS